MVGRRRLRQAASAPASWQQEELWQSWREWAPSSLGNVALELRLHGPLAAYRLRRSVARLHERHRTLRTVLQRRNGSVAQTVPAHAALPFSTVDLGALAAARGSCERRRLARREVRRCCDLERGPLFRAILIRHCESHHRLLLCGHLAAIDDGSWTPLVEDLAVFYRRAESAAAPALPAPARYADFARRQRRDLTAERLASAVQWWRRRLHRELGSFSLPTDHPQTSAPGIADAVSRQPLPASLPRALAERDAERETHSFLAGFVALLTRYTGDPQPLLGVLVSHRRWRRVGLYRDTLLLPAEAGGDPDFAQLRTRIRRFRAAALAWSDVPLGLVVEQLAPDLERRQPPVRVLFDARKASRLPAELAPGIALSCRRLLTGAGPVELALGVERGPAGRELRAEYRRDLFEPTTIVRLLRHLTALLQGAAECPERRISQLPVLTASEAHQLLEEWADNPPLELPGRLLHQRFEELARRQGDAAALVTASSWVSYGGLERRAARLAAVLRRRGVGPETAVAIFLGRSERLVVAVLGVLKAGGAYVPLDPAYPQQRIAYILATVAAPLVLSERALADRLPPAAVAVLELDDEPQATGELGLPRLAGSARQLAYVIFTSGSTGRPKGVAIEHRSALQLMAWARRTFTPGELSAVLAATSICFDLSVFELFAPLSWGGTVVLAENALQLPAHPAAAAVSLVNTVPSAMAELVRQDTLPTTLQTVNLAGEALTRSLVEQIYRRQQVERVWNLYGPSEDTTYSTGVMVPPGLAAEPTIGRPLPGSQGYVLDPWLRLLPVAVPGELHLAGAGLARGYFANPRKTATSFVPDPYTRRRGARLYRTGDLTRYRADGELEFLGRLDHQIKLRGFRIELGEIETVLQSHPAVREAAVLVRQDVPGNPCLAAYVGAADETLAPALRAHVEAHLPHYMVPAAVEVLAALPRTPNGKLDRRALARRPPVAAASAAESHRARPRTPTEELLAGIWAEVLGVERVRSEDDFFALGGHSLLASRVLSRLREVTGVTLSMQRLFAAPTAAALAAAVDAAARAETPAAAPAPGKLPRRQALPLSFMQEGLWLLHYLETSGISYNVPVLVRLRGPLAVAALGAALDAVMRRHEVLRTRFPAVRGRPRQVIMAPQPLPLPVIDLDRLEGAARESEAARLALKEGRKPFDLARGPVLRAVLLRRCREDHALIFTMHHIICDSWTIERLVAELSELYQAAVAARPAALPALPLQYADFALWERRWWSNEVLRPQLEFWRRQLAGAPERLELPSDRPPPARPSARGGNHPFALSASLTGALERLGQRHGTTLFMTLLAAFQVALWRYSGQRDVSVGTPVSLRTRLELEPLFGLFLNNLVLRTRIVADSDFTTLLAAVRRTALDAFVHRDLPFDQLVAELHPERVLGHQVLFQVALVVEHAPPPPPADDLDVSYAELANGTRKLDLSLFFLARGGRLEGRLEYARDLFDACTAARWAHHLETLLAAAAAAPERRLTDLPLLGEGERQQLFVEWNDSGAAVPGLCVHQLVATPAAESPEALAVASGGERLSYGELNRQANRLARHLRRLGVGPEAPVAVLAEPGVGMIVAYLGVLKAGGAYVPLDPAHPPARLSYIVEHTAAPVVLTAGPPRPAPAAPQAQVVYVDGGRQAFRRQSSAEPPAVAVADNLAYVIYTSGSSGEPKGVAVTHRSLVNLVAWHRRRYRITAADRATQVAGLGFDAAVWEIWPYLAAGASLYVVEQERRMWPERLRDYLVATGVTVTFLPTPLAERMLGLQWPRATALRALLTGGDRLRQHAPPRLSFELVNHYGPTESTVVTTAARVGGGNGGGRRPPIGAAIANLRLYVLDRWQRPLPSAVYGELHVGGEGLARGYLRQPRRTAESFVPDPFAEGAGGRLYRSGDLVRWSGQGQLEFLGRRDFQVKVRGFRIEPGEIESRLAEHPGVLEAAVVAREESSGERYLAAYVVVPEGARPPSAEELRSHLQQRLPEYMLPVAFVPLPRLPLTVNGKVDRRALPAPERPAGEAAVFMAPRNATEEALAGIWSQVLETARVGVNDNFFTLRGNSLQAAQVMSRVHERWGVELGLRQLFEHPTLGALAGSIERCRSERCRSERSRDSATAPAQPDLTAARQASALTELFTDQGEDELFQELAAEQAER